MAFADYRHRVPLRVRWAEVDPQGVVFNGHYLAYCDICVTEYWRALGMTYPAAFLATGVDLFVRRAALEYHSPALYDDELEICGRSARFGTTSLTFAVEMFRSGQRDRALIAGELVYVCTDPATRIPQRVPDKLRASIRAFESTPPFERAADVAD